MGMASTPKYLLVVPKFPIPNKSRNHKNFLPIGLLKIGTHLQKDLKVKKKDIQLVYGNEANLNFKPDEIWVTSLFTYWSEYFWDSVRHYRERFPQSLIRVGGIYVSLHSKNDNEDVRKKFQKRCKVYNVKPHFGLHERAEKHLPDYSLLPNNPHSIDYQIVHSTRGCERECKFCFTWKLEPDITNKSSIKGEIEDWCRKIVFYDNNLLMNPHIGLLLQEISTLKRRGHHVRCESQSGFDGRVLEKRPELAKALKIARFDNPRIAWDGKLENWKHIKKQIDILRNAGYHSKDISIFMIFNWDIPLIEMEHKRIKCWHWGVQITDCRNRPIHTISDNYSSRKKQTTKDYYIHKNWSDDEIKEFRKSVRRQNICVRHNYSFWHGVLERKGVSKKLSMKYRKMSKIEIKKILSDTWFPDEIHIPLTSKNKKKGR